jgi:hypothetical protein
MLDPDDGQLYCKGCGGLIGPHDFTKKGRPRSVCDKCLPTWELNRDRAYRERPGVKEKAAQRMRESRERMRRWRTD